MVVGDIKYIQKLFREAISDMATGTGSLSKRLAAANANYFYKIEWDKDIQLIPKVAKDDFKALGDMLSIDVEREKDKTKKKLFGASTNEMQIADFIDDAYVITRLHWRKSKRIAESVVHVDFLISLEQK